MNRAVRMQAEWVAATFRTVCLPTKQWNPNRDKRDTIRYIDVSAVGRESFVVEKSETLAANAAPSRARKIVLAGDCIFATVRPRLLRVAYIDRVHDDQIASTAFCVLRADRAKAIPQFIYFLLRAGFIIDAIASHESGASYPAVSDSNVLDCEFSLPPKAEQEKIAAVLWKLQRAIAAQDRLIVTTRDLKQSAMHCLFTRGLRDEPPKETDIGPMPESWRVLSLGNLGRIGNGSTPKKTQPEYWQQGKTPWLTSGKIHEGIIYQADQFVSDIAIKECHLPLVPAGSLLVAITGQGKTLGNSALIDFDTTINQHLAYVRFEHKDAHPQFVYQFMRSRYEELQAVGRAGGSTKAALTCAFLRDFPIPFPSKDEQRDIAAALTTIDRKLAHHQKKRAALNDLFQTLLHKLMTGEIRVADIDIDTSEITAPPGATA